MRLITVARASETDARKALSWLTGQDLRRGDTQGSGAGLCRGGGDRCRGCCCGCTTLCSRCCCCCSSGSNSRGGSARGRHHTLVLVQEESCVASIAHKVQVFLSQDVAPHGLQESLPQVQSKAGVSSLLNLALHGFDIRTIHLLHVLAIVDIEMVVDAPGRGVLRHDVLLLRRSNSSAVIEPIRVGTIQVPIDRIQQCELALATGQRYSLVTPRVDAFGLHAQLCRPRLQSDV
mmetsp:Transcript_133833/g.334105  ORF Transcript_133833/g.334105 Transcript_133833/m.334105 type:complete len:233 (+) Transcript_133833:801-1499(+)